MGDVLNELDKKCFTLAIDMANKSYEAGDFPVGAVLVIDDKIFDTSGNERNKESWVTHAENSLLIRNDINIKQAHKENKIIKLYTTLEPCIQCLGASIMNRVDQIFFIQKDGIGGACDIKSNNLGAWYGEIWPKIYHIPFSDKPRQLLVKFFENEINSDKSISEWYKKCYEYYSKKL